MSHTALSQGRDTDLADAACGLPWPFAQVLELQTNTGPGPQGKRPPNQPGHRRRCAGGGRKGVSSRQGLTISFLLQTHLLPTIKGRGWTDLRPQFSCHPQGQSGIPGVPRTLPGSGDTRSLTACSQQGVPSFGLASVPPTLKEMSPAHSLSCNEPQQNHQLPGVPSPRLCGRTPAGSPPMAWLLGEESEEAGEPRTAAEPLAGEEPCRQGSTGTLRCRALGEGQRGRTARDGERR